MQRALRDAQPAEVRAAKRVVQRGGELGVGDGFGRGQVERAAGGARGRAGSGSRGSRRSARSSSSPASRRRSGAARQSAPGSSSRASTPPPLPRTRPLRRCATRMPACARGLGGGLPVGDDAGQEPLPAGASSVTSRPPVSPYQPIAEAAIRTFGGGCLRGQHGGQRPGGQDPAGPDLRLVGPGPAVVADARARQVHAGVDAAERRIARVGGARVPADLVGRRAAAA